MTYQGKDYSSYAFRVGSNSWSQQYSDNYDKIFNKKMKIAAYLPHLYCFGGNRRFIEIGNEFIRRGHEFNLYVDKADSKPNWMEFLGLAEDARDIDFKDLKEDVLMLGDPSGFERLQKFPGLKLLYLIGGGDYVKQYENYLKENSVNFLVGNNYWYKPLFKEAHIIVGGVNTDFFKPLNIEKVPNSILFYGRWNSGHLGLNELYEQIKGRGHLMAFDQKRYMKDDIEEYSCTTQEQLREVYNKATIFVSAHNCSGINNTVLEAMACGCPVVTNGIGTDNITKDGFNALVVPTDKIGETVSMLLKDPGLQYTLRKNALETVKEYSWKGVVDKILTLVEPYVRK